MRRSKRRDIKHGSRYIYIFNKQSPEMFYKNGVPKNFTKLLESLFDKVAGLQLY